MFRRYTELGIGAFLIATAIAMPFIWRPPLVILPFLIAALGMWLMVGPQRLTRQREQARAALSSVFAADRQLGARYHLLTGLVVIGRATLVISVVIGVASILGWTGRGAPLSIWVAIMGGIGWLTSTVAKVAQAGIEVAASRVSDQANVPPP
jgi:hypothetical protein